MLEKQSWIKLLRSSEILGFISLIYYSFLSIKYAWRNNQAE